jgi:two-component system, OmpR family, heavy metal sensor histidine kinase CusS
MEGVGLGLSLAREIVRAHQGELRLAATQPGEVGIILVLPKKQFSR